MRQDYCGGVGQWRWKKKKVMDVINSGSYSMALIVLSKVDAGDKNAYKIMAAKWFVKNHRQYSEQDGR
jgi:hypothetical protein